ncbi:hypothetical protein [Aromatoleum buckelii]|uniref:Uncharacterized protein n=1 Tax=Aromatoleum buckelii TaxID=200254 RepID=A0ABX1N2B2_9RHOO|nr:hypothetical protein [Aromatoleum buckelii]MCK0510240.1 hypothetical protein [Aromatoleum buckelii]
MAELDPTWSTGDPDNKKANLCRVAFCWQIDDLPVFDLERAMGIEPDRMSIRKYLIIKPIRAGESLGRTTLLVHFTNSGGMRHLDPRQERRRPYLVLGILSSLS